THSASYARPRPAMEAQPFGRSTEPSSCRMRRRLHASPDISPGRACRYANILRAFKTCPARVQKPQTHAALKKIVRAAGLLNNLLVKLSGLSLAVMVGSVFCGVRS
ncbi:MAG TPA: hypothetical protein VEN28_07875, partial [Burkholderiaceae bacterium]|nr:hypothetical protein [Burkholderiaceae bacterium]